MGKIILKVFMGRETVRLHRLLFNAIAQAGSLPNSARAEAVKLADSYAAIDDGIEDGQMVGSPSNIAGIEVLRNPVEWGDDAGYIKTFWNLSIYRPGENNRVEFRKSFSTLWDLYSRAGSEGIILPDGLIQWAAQSLPGDEILLNDNRTGKIFEIIVTSQNPIEGRG